MVRVHLVAQQHEIRHAAGGAHLLDQHLSIGEHLLVGAHMDLLLVLIGDRAHDFKHPDQLDRDEELMVLVVTFVLDALVKLGHTAGILLVVVHRVGEVVLQLHLSGLVQLVKKLHILELVGKHIKLRHTKRLLFF